MIDAETFIFYTIIVYMALGVTYIILGAGRGTKTYVQNYGIADVITGLILLGIGMGMYVL